MAISLVEGFESLKTVKRNIGNISTLSKAEWGNTVNEQIYNAAIMVNPEDYCSILTVPVISGTKKYDKPTDFKNMNAPDCGVFKTGTGVEFGILYYDNEVTAFAVDEIVTGVDSGAIATIEEVQSTFFRLSSISGTFENNEQLTGSIAGDVLVNGTITKFSETSDLEKITKFGSQDEGYYFEKGKFVITPLPTAARTLLCRYIPKETVFTEALTGNFIEIDNAGGIYLELIRDLLMIQYEVNDRNALSEQQASIRAATVLNNFFANINKQPTTYLM